VESDELSDDSKTVLNHLHKIAQILVIGSGFGVLVVVVRLVGGDTIEIPAIKEKVPLGWVPVVYAVGTACHIYLTFYVIQALSIIVGDPNTTDRAESRRLWNTVRTNGSVILNDKRMVIPEPGKRLALMSWRDPTTGILVGMALLTAVAILPWYLGDGLHSEGGWTLAIGVATAAAVVGLNWWAGGLWIISVSRLTTEDGLSKFTPWEGSIFLSARKSANASKWALVLVTAVSMATLIVVGIAT
jgi:hypothetical protein